MNDVRLKLSPPWTIFVHKLEALFDPDPMIAFNVDYGAEDGPRVVISTSDGDKAAALLKLLPDHKDFGNVTLKIGVDCAHISNRAFTTPTEVFDTAFKGNPVYSYSICPSEEGYQWFSMTYVVFKNCVVQFFADNINDCHGVISTLYQDIAAEIFEESNIHAYYNTDIELGKLGRPLGEWP